MLAGQHAAHPNTELQDLGTEFLGALELVLLAGIEQDERVEIAVAGVKDIGAGQAIFGREIAHGAEHGREILAGNGAVHAEIVRRYPPDGREGCLASGPEFEPLLLRGRGAHQRGAVRLRDIAHPPDQMLDLGQRPVELDDQQGIDIEGVTSMDEVLGRGDGEAVHHLHPGRDDAVRDHVGDALAGSLDLGEADQQRAGGFGLAQDADGDLGDDAEQSSEPVTTPMRS